MGKKYYGVKYYFKISPAAASFCLIQFLTGKLTLYVRVFKIVSMFRICTEEVEEIRITICLIFSRKENKRACSN
jgi:hypothetical protein